VQVDWAEKQSKNMSLNTNNDDDGSEDQYKKLFREQSFIHPASSSSSNRNNNNNNNNEINYFEQLEEYVQFKKHIAKKMAVTLKPNQKTWTYYQHGDKSLAPLIIVPDLCATSESMYQQILALVPRGFHLIVVDIAPCYTHDEFAIAFKELIEFHLCLSDLPFHMMGLGLGGFLSQYYCEKNPDTVASLILCNSFIDNNVFDDIFSDFYQLMPNFLLKTKILSRYTNYDIQGEPMIVHSNEYMVESMQRLPHRILASRLSLLCQSKRINRGAFLSSIPDDKVTIIDTLDRTIYPAECRVELHKMYSNAKFAFLKTGGTYPYLSRSDEFNIQVTVHMRNIAGQNQPVYDVETTGDNNEQEHESDDNRAVFSPILIDERNEDDYLVHSDELNRQQHPQQRESKPQRQEASIQNDDDTPIF
jgi:maspardin